MVKGTPLTVLALLFVQLCFSGYAVISKHVLTGSHKMSSGVFILCRDVGCSVVLLCVARATTGGWAWPKKADRFDFVLLGICNVYFGQYCFVMGIMFTSALTGSLWQNTIPVFTLVLSVLAGREAMPLGKAHSWLRLAGVASTVGGAVAFTLLQHRSGVAPQGENVPLGSAFFFLQCFFGSAFFVIQKGLLEKYDALHVVAWGYAVGGTLMILVVVPQLITSTGWWLLSKEDVLAILYVIFISSSLCYGLYGWANKRTSPVFIVTIGPSQIVFTALLELFIFGTEITTAVYVGGALVSTGVFLIVAGQLQMEREKVLGGGVQASLLKPVSFR